MRLRLSNGFRAGLQTGAVLLLCLSSSLPVGQTSAAAPYLATDLLGQTDSSGGLSWATDDPNNQRLPDTGGVYSAIGVVQDSVHHKLYVVEGANANRVSVFNLNTNNQLADRIADYVIGQTKFGTNGSGASAAQLYLPMGAAIDTANQRLFVADTYNNRVLVYDVSALATGMAAVHVLGQTNFTANAAATTQTGFNKPSGLAYDAANQRLFVSDLNRVLVFSVATITDGMAATNVIGKPNFTATSCTISASCGTSLGLEYDATNQRLFVGDESHNRILIFNVASVTNGMNASYVLGQTDFVTAGAHVTTAGLTQPRYFAYDSAGQRLFATDGDRILVYPTASLSNGLAASAVLGQPNFTTSGAALDQSHVTSYGLAYDAANQRLYSADWPHERIVLFDTTSITNGMNAVDELGQTDVDGTLWWDKKNVENKYTNPNGVDNPTAVTMDPAAHRLYVSDMFNSRVLMYNLDSTNTLVDRRADAVLGQSSLYGNASIASQTGLDSPEGLAFDPDRQWLFVADAGNNRVLVYDVANVTTGEAAVHVLGQPDYTTNASGRTATVLDNPQGVTYDAVHQRLFVADHSNNRVMVYDVAGITDGEPAVAVIGQPDFTNYSYGSDAGGLKWDQSVSYDPINDRLYVSDSWDARILVFDTATITNGEDAIYVIGQPDFATYNSSSPARNTTSNIQGIFFDPSTQRLYAATWDNVVLAYDTTQLANGMDASFVFGAPDFTTYANGYPTQSSFEEPYNLYVDPTNQRLYVADDWGSRVVIYDQIRITTDTLAAGTVGKAYSATITSSGSQGTVTYAVTAGSLPAGLSLASNGAISGTPIAAGPASFAVTATDDNGDVGSLAISKIITLTVAAAAVITTPAPTPSAAPVTRTASPASPTPTPTPSPAPTTAPVALLNEQPGYAADTGTTQNLQTGQVVGFDLPAPTISTGGTTATVADHHTATVNAVGSDYVELTIASEPIHVRLTIGQSQEVDVDRDGTPDLFVKLASITSGQANLVFRRLAVAQTTAATPAPQPSSRPGTSTNAADSAGATQFIWAYVVAGIVALGLLLLAARWLVARRRQPPVSPSE